MIPPPELPKARHVQTPLWASIKNICRDACLEGDTPALRGAVGRLSDAEIEEVRRTAFVLLIVGLDEKTLRGLR